MRSTRVSIFVTPGKALVEESFLPSMVAGPVPLMLYDG